MLHERADMPHSQLPREDGAPGPSGGARAYPGVPSPRPWSLSGEPRHRGLLPSPHAPGCCFSSLPGTPRGGDTQDAVESGPRRWAAVASPGGTSGQWVAMATPQAPPQGLLGSRKGSLPCLQGATPRCHCFYSFPRPPNSDLVPTVCQALRI